MYDDFSNDSLDSIQRIQCEIDSCVMNYIKSVYGFACTMLKVNCPFYQVAYIDKDGNNETFANDPVMQMKLYTRMLTIQSYPFMTEDTIKNKLDPYSILNRHIYKTLHNLLYTDPTDLNTIHIRSNNQKNWMYTIIHILEDKFFSITNLGTISEKYIILSNTTENNQLLNDFIDAYAKYISNPIDIHPVLFGSFNVDTPFVELGSIHGIKILCDVWDRSNRITCGTKEANSQSNITFAYYKAELAKPSFSLMASFSLTAAETRNIQYVVPTVRCNIDRNNPNAIFSTSFELINNGFEAIDCVKENNDDIYLI